MAISGCDTSRPLENASIYLQSVHEDSLSPRWGFGPVPLCTHGLRRGLYSCAASRLIMVVSFHRGQALEFSPDSSGHSQMPRNLSGFTPLRNGSRVDQTFPRG